MTTTDAPTLFDSDAFHGATYPGDPGPIIAAEARIAGLRRALVDCLAHVEAGTPAPGVRIREWRELAGVPYVDGLTPTDRRDEGTARAGAKWTDEEVAAVDAAIRAVATALVTGFVAERAPAHVENVRAHPGAVGDQLLEFTADNVWRELGPEFPVTKGLTGRLIAAKGAGVIRSTGTTRLADRGGDHDHGQRLTVWQAIP